MLFAFALLLRVTGLITFFNADENWSASVRVLTGDLSGGIPSAALPLHNYLNALSFVPLYGIGRLVGVWHGTADFRAQYFRDPTPFVFAGRLVAACLGALTAVLAALIASRLGLSRRSSLVVGGLVALFPMDVLLSHMAKTDSGVAFGVLLLTWSILRKLDDPGAKRSDILVGVALAITMSFKQTALLLVAPLLAGMAALLKWDRLLPWSQVARGLFITLVASLLAWVPMNIGVLLNVKGFLEWQRFLLVMVEAGKPMTVYQTAELAIRMLSQSFEGMTAVALMVWLFAPLFRRDRTFLMIWGSSAFAIVAINVANGPVIYGRYYLPYAELAYTLACVAALSLVERRGPAGILGASLAAAVLVSSTLGSAEIVKQVMTTPMSARCSKIITEIAHPDRDKILTSSRLGVPVSSVAVADARDREERLAKKYGVKLPERPAEKMAHSDKLGRGYYVRAMPHSLGGDPNRQGSLSSKVGKLGPGWWPIQPEEFDLDYWTTRGFNIFVLHAGAGFSDSGNPLYDEPIYRSFHEQIKERCELVATLPTSRPLFSEQTVWIYRLRRPMAHGPR